MPLRTLARLPGAAGARVSRFLHTFVFSLPSPKPEDATNGTAAAAAASVAVKGGAVSSVASAALEAVSADDRAAGYTRTTAAAAAAADPAAGIGAAAVAVPDPGASRALAAGIGPLSFVGSGYGMMLVFMAILLNRIHHIVQRPRAPPPTIMPHHPPTTLYGLFRLKLAHCLTGSSTPSALRLPGLFGLFRAWLLFSVVTLQTAELWPSDVTRRVAEATEGVWPAYASAFAAFLAHTVDRVGAWAGQMEMADVCWNVFLCVCSGLVFGALANGLERTRRRDAGASFNLFGYSFLLHLYSSPLTHHSPPPDTNHGRPDVHALFHLWVGLTELTWLQALELSTTMRRNQLLPTGVCGALGLIHFVYALLTAPLRFPSFTFVTHLLALLLSLVVLSTIVLRAITHLLTIGYIPSPVWPNLLPHEGAMPSLEDDAGVALLKLGTACIEASSGPLHNELAPVHIQQPSLKLSVAGCDAVDLPPHKRNGGGLATRIDNIKVTELSDPNADSRYARELGNFWRACVGLATDVFWCTLLGTAIGRRLYFTVWNAYHARWWYGPRHWRIWRREAWAAPRRARRHEPPPLFAHGEVWARSNGVRIRPELPAILGASDVAAPHLPPEIVAEVDYTYDQVLRGEVELADDDNDEDEWESHASASSVGSLSDGEDEDGGVALYRDLVLPHGSNADESPVAGSSSSLQPILLAHLTADDHTPVTRRRYAAMVAQVPTPPPVDHMAHAIQQRRAEVDAAGAVPRDSWEEDVRHTCIVCMTQPRDVIVWPCRCLLMCDDCRENLAARLPSKDHACPSCRTKVEGYSRIYVP